MNIQLTAGSQPSINVPMRRHHSTDGTPRWGYAGAGPADTALSILAHFLPLGISHPSSVQGETSRDITLWDTTQVSPLAWELHQDFKRAWLEHLEPEQSHELNGMLLNTWIQAALGWTKPTSQEEASA